MTTEQNAEQFSLLMKPWFDGLNMSFDSHCLAKFDELGVAMLNDPLYPSVSKIFAIEEIAQKHFLDSVAPLGLGLPCFRGQPKIFDLGTGGGFPAIPLAIVFPDSNVTGIDSRAKSADFVKRMADNLALKNLDSKHARIEEVGHDPAFREQADLVVCRALSAVRTLLEYALPLVKPGGYALFYKGPRLDQELADAANALKVMNIKASDMQFKSIKPPLLPFERGFLLIKKTVATSPKFPRKNGVPASNPL